MFPYIRWHLFLDVLKIFLNNGLELAEVWPEWALWVFTVWSHQVSSICGFTSFVKFETLLVIFSSFPETPMTDVETLACPSDSSGSFFSLSYLYTGKFLLVYLGHCMISVLFWAPKFTLGSSLYFYFSVETVHLSTHFKKYSSFLEYCIKVSKSLS